MSSNPADDGTYYYSHSASAKGQVSGTQMGAISKSGSEFELDGYEVAVDIDIGNPQGIRDPKDRQLSVHPDAPETGTINNALGVLRHYKDDGSGPALMGISLVLPSDLLGAIRESHRHGEGPHTTLHFEVVGGGLVEQDGTASMFSYCWDVTRPLYVVGFEHFVEV